MAKISEFIEQTGEFLKAEIVGQSCKAKITKEAVIEHNQKYDADRLHIPIDINGKEYTFDASRTNARTIAAVLGDDTKNWIGKEIELETYKTKTSDGKMVNAINVKAVIV